MHVQPLLGDPGQRCPTRRISDVPFQLGPFGAECGPALLEATLLARARQPYAPSPYDACGHQDETEEGEGDYRAPSHVTLRYVG